MNNTAAHRKCRALTLVEILVAVGLMSAVMIPVMVSFGAGNRGLSMSSEELTTHTAAIELLEQIMASPFDLVPTGVFRNEQIRDGQLMSSATPLRFHISSVPDIERQLLVTNIEKDGRVRLKKVAVTITLKDRDSKAQPRRFTVKSLLAREN
ncbi:MAG TPA: prepilin-type N-terminal cleavage/methylation domain-containing protein [Candidatus Ozemobacteraceae bacterium]|nr:prepilin-type N-terminal cleavage/methylation domain-containing protein [Candidatus Ozemobacteraceae bacterium]